MNHRILVTPRSLTEAPHPSVENLRNLGIDIVYSKPGKLPSEAELLQLMSGTTGWLAGVEPISHAVIESARHLKVISRNGTGIDNLPLAKLRDNNIIVRTADGANAAGVAELTIGLMFAALRHIPSTDHGIKHSKWPRKRGLEIRGRTLGVVGCGAVGRDVARLGAALGAKVIAYDPARPLLDIPVDEFRYVELNALFSQSDIITLHCPPPRNGKLLIDAAVLGIFRPGTILINTARASLIDEQLLVEALDARQLSVYATDVFDPEPPTSLLLAARPDVIATSHIGGYTQESIDRATEMAIANLLESLGHHG
jgi:D-3-phosphoglycerate dehydrogenase / 2-oxoglutarate reductase